MGGEARTDVVKVKRPQKMFSLDNAYSEEDVAEFLKRVRTGLPDRETPRFVVEPKLDGASIEVVYEGGKLVQASTRGDGETGEDITENLRTVRGVPATIDHQPRLTLRGEVVIYRKDLETLNVERAALGLEPYANPRNAAAGAVRMLDPREVAKRPLRALFYQALEGPQIKPTHGETLTYLGELGLPTHRRHVVATPSRSRGRGDRAGQRRHGGDPRHRRAAAALPVRDRRRGGEGRLVPPAGHARRDQQVSQVGHRLQVRRRAGGDHGARHRGAGGAHRGAHAGGRARSRWSSPARPCRGRPCTTRG